MIGGVRPGMNLGLKQPQREASCVVGEGPTENSLKVLLPFSEVVAR